MLHFAIERWASGLTNSRTIMMLDITSQRAATLTSFRVHKASIQQLGLNQPTASLLLALMMLNSGYVSCLAFLKLHPRPSQAAPELAPTQEARYCQIRDTTSSQILGNLRRSRNRSHCLHTKLGHLWAATTNIPARIIMPRGTRPTTLHPRGIRGMFKHPKATGGHRCQASLHFRILLEITPHRHRLTCWRHQLGTRRHTSHPHPVGDLGLSRLSLRRVHHRLRARVVRGCVVHLHLRRRNAPPF